VATFVTFMVLCECNICKIELAILTQNGGEGENMTKIEAIIKPFRLTEVQEALTALGIQGMTVSEVKGFGRQKGHVELYRGAEYTVNFVPKLYIMTVVQDDQAQKAVDAIQKAAYTGKIGDGKIFLSKIDEAVRIRTKETGSEAL
jgi:nitrogen regulatory protein P-II 1